MSETRKEASDTLNFWYNLKASESKVKESSNTDIMDNEENAWKCHSKESSTTVKIQKCREILTPTSHGHLCYSYTIVQGSFTKAYKAYSRKDKV